MRIPTMFSSISITAFQRARIMAAGLCLLCGVGVIGGMALADAVYVHQERLSQEYGSFSPRGGASRVSLAALEAGR